MKKFAMAAAALALSASFANAGGLNEAVTEEVMVEKAAGSGWIIPLVLLVAVAGLAASNSSSTTN